MNLRHALPGSTARQLFNSSTLLDSSTARQTSTDLDRPRHPGTCSQSLDLPRQARQLLDSYSTAGQLLDSYSTGSTGKALTAPRQRPRQRLDGASTARQLDSQGSTTIPVYFPFMSRGAAIRDPDRRIPVCPARSEKARVLLPHLCGSGRGSQGPCLAYQYHTALDTARQQQQFSRISSSAASQS